MVSPLPRSFVLGETVTVYARVSAPGTKQPEDPDSVTLTGLALAGGAPIAPATTAFTRVNEGQYALDISTAGLGPGTYNYVVTVTGTDTGGATKVTKAQDRFVLSAPLVTGA